MQTLKEAIHNFHSSFFGSSAELLDQLGCGDEWIAAIVTCSELGAATELAVKARPGELYVVQNFGNLVPGQQFDNGGGPTVSSIQYAINQLGVKHVIVSGHMKCRTVELLLKDAEAERYSHWLEQAGRTRQVISEQYDHLDAASRIRAACQENVLVQLKTCNLIHSFARDCPMASFVGTPGYSMTRQGNSSRMSRRPASSRRSIPETELIESLTTESAYETKVMKQQSPSYSISVRLRYTSEPGQLGRITSAIGEADGLFGAIDIVDVRKGHSVRDITIKHVEQNP